MLMWHEERLGYNTLIRTGKLNMDYLPQILWFPVNIKDADDGDFWEFCPLI